MSFGVASLPDVLQPPLLGALPGPVFGFLIDHLQHLGKVTEETGLVISIIALGAGAGGLVAAMMRRFGKSGAQPAAADPLRRRLLQLAPLAVGGTAFAVVAVRLLPDWYQALRPPEGSAGAVGAITPSSSFYIVSKNFSDPIVVTDSWRLRIQGLVEFEQSLEYSQLQALPQAVELVTLECVSNPVGGRLMSTGRFDGPRLADLLAMARPRGAARYVAFQANDGYTESLALADIGSEILVALQLNGSPLPDKHGFPARLLVPGRYGMKGPKWLEAIELVEKPPTGYWEGKGWGFDAIVKTTSRIDAPSDGATISGQPVRLAGVAFAGARGVSKVEWSADGGKSWRPADLEPSGSQFSWRLWEAHWQPGGPGRYTLMVRATDESGNLQESTATNSFPNGSTGLHSVAVSVLTS
ncbi:MAG TPA: molybdopterin-dependent oxidoreductase [Candidatus Dormibacteraeota bacterium]|nr:molybdopterin-dependent oxidoreductase [Candidatus Dormibacteraeota bacterium]